MKIKLLCIAVALALTASVAAAQSDAQAYILQAYENTQALETFVYEIESVVGQTMGASGMDIESETTITTTTQGQRVGETLNLATTTQTMIGSMMGEFGFGFELIYVDGRLWARGGMAEADAEGAEGMPDLSGMMGDTFATMFPEEWTDITETPDAYPSLTIYSDPDVIFSQLTDFASLYTLGETAMTDVVELDPEELDGRSVRVFQFTADPSSVSEEAQAAIESAVAASMQAAGDTGGMFEGMMEDMMESMQITITIYIDEAENVVVQSVIEQTSVMNMAMQGMEMTIDQLNTTTARLVEYNTDIVIEAPVR